MRPARQRLVDLWLMEGVALGPAAPLCGGMTPNAGRATMCAGGVAASVVRFSPCRRGLG